MADIYCKDLQDISAAVIDYYEQVEQAGTATVQASEALSSLSGFQGAGPDAIKTYFLEVHAGLAPSFISLFDHFRDQFTAYAGMYMNAPVNETSSQGRLPSNGISEVKKDVQGVKKSLSSDVDSHLSRANAKVSEAEISLSKPSANSIRVDIEECIAVLIKLIDDIDANESHGLNMFCDDSLLERIQCGLKQAVATCMQPGYIANYTPGKVMQEPWFPPLAQALEERETYKEEHFEELRQVERDLADKRETRIKAEYEAARKEKLFWSGVGTVASMVGLVAGVAALVVTTGPIALTVGALGVGISMIDTFERSQSLNRQLGGKAEDDRMENTPSGAGKDALDEYMGYAEKIEEYGVRDGSIEEMDDLKGYVTEKTVEAGVTVFAYEISGNKEGSEALGKLGGKLTTVGDEATKIAKGGVKGATAGVMFVTEVVTAGADYKVNEADKKLDACNEQFAQVEKTRDQIDSTPRHIENAWASAA